MIKFSRSTVEKSLSCPLCCIYDHRHKCRPFSLPFTLNSAVDNLCKNEFDHYRAKQEPHPLFVEHGIDAVPFQHEKIDEWRTNFTGIRHIDEVAGYNFGGAVDDVWQKPNGDLIVADVKATSKKAFSWDEIKDYPYAQGYKRQLEMYQWLFRKNGFSVANEAYLVYFNGLKNEAMFNQELKFELHVVKLECNADWVEEAVLNTKTLLETPGLPAPGADCDHCKYVRDRSRIRKENQ